MNTFRRVCLALLVAASLSSAAETGSDAPPTTAAESERIARHVEEWRELEVQLREDVARAKTPVGRLRAHWELESLGIAWGRRLVLLQLELSMQQGDAKRTEELNQALNRLDDLIARRGEGPATPVEKSAP